ncbi:MULTISPECIES: PhzF family phenazine biosynthesis protein [Streptomyces]|uniref:Oxidoreductase n=1 Tax=Streptomyces spororaveus TaxID=284039 RepID=A0ABQ3T459_9ACTN|nr:PhzF family phenazine biosynthesis protein [Streptomyces spororaveus]MCM9076992.1 PhzF family phenazine biosynthesis protein [Streptomyces spororaveus]GHI75179.1 oxidoreductase [Streptomyces spororaveus]
MRIQIVDAFTSRPFTGNPAGVCLLPVGPWPDDVWLGQLAAELNHPETAFALPLPAGSEADWEIRWFTPLVEANLCGHATLATVHTLRREGLLTGGPVRFLSRSSGLLTAWAEGSDGEDGVDGVDGEITLDFPAAPGAQVPVPAGLADALGVRPEATFRTGALGDLLTVLPDEAAVRALRPDLEAIAALSLREGVRGVIVTAAAEAAGSGYDFVSRFFAPARGIPEDPVTGSAHTALAPYWAARLGRGDALTGLQASGRPGQVKVALHGDRVLLTGRAVTVLEATLSV